MPPESLNFAVSSYQIGSAFYDKEILIALPHGKRSIRPQELVAEDLGEEDVVGHILWFEHVAADGAVSRAEVARFPGLVQRAEGVGDVLGELRAGGSVNGIGAREGFEIPESVEGLDNFLWIGQDGDRVRLEACAGSVAGFKLAVEDEGWEGEFLGRQTEAGAKEDFGRRPVRAMRPMPFSR